MKKYLIKRKSAVKPITGSIVDTTNIDDKTTNTYSANVIDGFNTYSTEEQVIGTWFGKPLYKKGISGTTPANSSGTILTSGLKIKRLIDYKGYIYDTNGDLSQAIGKSVYVDGSLATTGSKVYSSYGEAYIQVGSYLNSKEFQLTIYYTKTTS